MKKFIEKIRVYDPDLAYDILESLSRRVDGKYEVIFRDVIEIDANGRTPVTEISVYKNIAFD
jgi:hypothetical protein